MITLKYNSYNKITLAKYKELLSIMDEDISPIEKDIAVIALLADVSENEVYKLKPYEVNVLQQQLSFLAHPHSSEKRYKKLVIGGENFIVNSKLDELTISQYIDFQQMWKNDYINHLHEVLSIFIIPENHTYNDGYDVGTVRELIFENLDIETATNIAFFLHRKLIALIKDKVLYFRLMLWVMKWKMKDKELKKKITELTNLYKMMEKHLTDGYLSLTKFPS